MSDGADEEARPVADPAFRALLEKLSTAYSFDFREYKDASLARRIRARMSQVKVEGFDAYSAFLDQHPGEQTALFNTILINVTGFFRDPEAWTLMASDVIPRLVEDAALTKTIRVWCSGCSSGEEPYTVAMLLAEHLGDRLDDYTVKIYGTDVDEDALGAARHAVYRLDQLRDVPQPLVDRYFTREGHGYRFRRDIRRWCVFGNHNLAQAPPLSHVDLLVCRNVLIYFRSELQERILTRFHYAIRPGGYLFLGRSESLLARSRLFTPVQLKWRLFRRATPSLPARGALVLPEADGGAGEQARAAEPAVASLAVGALDALPWAVMVIDMSDTVVVWNPAAEALFDVPVAPAVGKKFRDLDVSYRIEGLRARIEDVKGRRGVSRLDDATFTRRTGDLVHADIVVSAILDGQRLGGIVVSALEATEHVRLKEQMMRIAEQHATAIEELQSTNEELETTNEELQSTNEELETTNEELQSTNEELETTVEELQATNTELAALNAELEGRTAELNRIDAHLQSLMHSLEVGVVVVDRAGKVTTWNRAAEQIWGLSGEQALGREFAALPIEAVVRSLRPAFGRVIGGGGLERVEIPPRAGGTDRIRMVQVGPLKDRGGELLGALAITARADDGSVAR